MTPPTEGYYNEGEDTSQAKRVKISDQTDEEENISLDEDEEDCDIVCTYVPDSVLDREILDTLPTFADLTLEAQERFSPPENPLFQLFSVRVNFSHTKASKVYGAILAADEFESLKDGWVAEEFEEGYKFVSLFYHRENDPQPIGEDGFLSLTNPSCGCSIPAFKSVEILSEVFVTLDDGDKSKLEVSNCFSTFNFSPKNVPQMYGLFQTETAEGDYGSITMYFIAFKYAVDAVLEVSFTGLRPHGNIISGSIEAYYGGDHTEYDYKCSPGEEKYFKLILFKADAPVHLDSVEIPLTRSVMVVHSSGSLVIQAHLFDCSGKTILDGKYEFPAKLRNFSTGKIEGPGCTISLKVNWKCKAVGT